MTEKKPRVFLGLHEIAGYYSNLERGLSDLGYDAHFYSFESHVFGYGVRNRSILLRIIVALRKWNGGNPEWLRARVEGIVQRLIKRLFYSCLEKYDIFIFGYNARFTNYIDIKNPRHSNFNDLQLLKKYGKTVVYVYHGSDARPPYIDGAIMAESVGRSIEDCIALTSSTKAKLSEIEKYADYIINSPSTGQFHCKKFINWFYIGVPYPLGKQESIRKRFEDVPVRILHCPSFPEAKGSAQIKMIIDRLIAEGTQIEYVCITNKPNREVLEEIEKSDIVIDQLYSDTPMAGFATEAASYGKPVLVGGYFASNIDKWVPASILPPTVFVMPDKMEEALRKLIDDVQLRVTIGQRARKFVEEEWNVRTVAERFEKIIMRQVPNDWWVDPYQIDYLEGGCISSERRKAIARKVLAGYSSEVFCLDDKPLLKQQIVGLANAVDC